MVLRECIAAKSLQSCPTLYDPIDGSPPGSPIPGILQARTLEVGCHFLLQCMKVKSESEVTQSCLTLHSPMDCGLPGSSVHGIFQVRVLEWGAIAFSTNTVYQCIYMEFRKMVTIPLYARQQKRYRYIEQSFGLCERGRGWDDLRA